MIKKIAIFTGFLLFIATAIIFYSSRESEKLQKEIAPEQQKEQVPCEEARGPRGLTPSNPADYGITLTNEFNAPKTQQEWDTLMQKKISELKTSVPAERWQQVQQSIKEDPKKTEESIRKADAAIEKWQAVLKKDPANVEAKRNIEQLMQLRSIGKYLPER